MTKVKVIEVSFINVKLRGEIMLMALHPCKRLQLIAAVLIFVNFSLCAAPTKPLKEAIEPAMAYEIGKEAYVYFYPLILMELTRKQLTNIEENKESGRGPMNMLVHMREYPSADFKTVVRPNFDTLYSLAWLDLTKEPIIVSVPDMHGRYYLLEMLDMWTDVFAAPGKRTTGTNAQNFLIAKQGWKGKLPKEVKLIQTPTPYIWIIGRTQTNGIKDYENVHQIQDGYRITPLSQWGKKALPVQVKIDPSVDMKTPPMEQINKMSAADYFKNAAELIKLNPPHITDQSIMARLNRIGFEEGKDFDLEKLDPLVKQALEKAAEDALNNMKKLAPNTGNIVNGWQINTDTIGVYGNNYLKRAIIALLGLGANLPEDAIYPFISVDSDGNALDGENNYVLHFSKEQLPPNNAFWSLTIYDNEGFPVANSINRFAIGDRDPLKFNADGSLDIYIQYEKPSEDKLSNWLPAPKGLSSIAMRIYAPKAEVLEGLWMPSAIKKINKSN